jgi:hypothetical protein
MQEDAGRQDRQHLVEQEVDVGAGHQDVARIDEQDVARCQLLKRRQATGRHGLRQPFDGQAAQRSARRRVDGEDLRGEAAIADGTRHEAGRMTAADLDDVPWTIPAHDGISHCRIETRKPILVPARRRRRLAANRTQRVRMFIERPQLSGELRCIDFEQLLDLLIGRSAPGGERRWA